MPFPIDEKYIKETEDKLHVNFPDSFRKKMMKENGGVITLGDDVWQFNPLLDKSDKKRIVRTCNDIVVETYSAKKEFWIS